MQRHAERDAAPDQPSGDVGADGIQAAMRQIDDPHDPEDQAQARGNKEEHRSVEQRVQNLDGQDRHRSPFRLALIPWPRVSMPNCDDRPRHAAPSHHADRSITKSRNTALRQLSLQKPTAPVGAGAEVRDHTTRVGALHPIALGQVVLIQFAAAVDSLWLVPGFGQPIGAVMLRIGMVMIRSGSQLANSYCGRFLLNPVTASL